MCGNGDGFNDYDAADDTNPDPGAKSATTVSTTTATTPTVDGDCTNDPV